MYGQAYNAWAGNWERANTKAQQDLETARYEDETTYNREQKDLDRQNAEKKDAMSYVLDLLDRNVMPDAGKLEAAGVSAADAQAILDSNLAAKTDAQVADALDRVKSMIAMGMTPSDEELAAAKLTRENANAYAALLNSDLAADERSAALDEFKFWVSLGMTPPASILNKLGLSAADAQQAIYNLANFSSGSGGRSSSGKGRTSGGGTPTSDPVYEEPAADAAYQQWVSSISSLPGASDATLFPSEKAQGTFDSMIASQEANQKPTSKPDTSKLSSFGQAVLKNLGTGTLANNPAQYVINAYANSGLTAAEKERDKSILLAYIQYYNL